MAACNDGDDNDGLVDHPDDPDCSYALDLTEDPRECSNGVDDDGDGRIDYRDEPGCTGPDDPSEMAGCSDGIDNDGDGMMDHPEDPGCQGPSSNVEDAAFEPPRGASRVAAGRSSPL